MAATVTNPWSECDWPGRESVESILQTYDIPQGLRERIRTIASRRCAEWQFESFADQYAYIAELVERFTMPWIERHAARLDQPVFEDGRQTLHDYIGSQDSALKSLILGKSPLKALHAREIVNILERHLPQGHLAFIEDLLCSRAEKSLWSFSADRVAKHVPSIVTTLKLLEQRYGRNGRIVLPPRPIKTVTRQSNGELKIRYGDRRYNGDPLAFFEEHADVYGGLTRRGLQKFDPGLYQAIRLSGQMSSAIPIRVFAPGRPISKDQIDRIIVTYEQTASLIKTARIVHSCRRTIRKYLDMKGLNRQGTGKVGATAKGINAVLNLSQVGAETSQPLAEAI